MLSWKQNQGRLSLRTFSKLSPQHHLLGWAEDFFKELFDLVHICFDFIVERDEGWVSPWSQVLKVCRLPEVQIQTTANILSNPVRAEVAKFNDHKSKGHNIWLFKSSRTFVIQKCFLKRIPASTCSREQGGQNYASPLNVLSVSPWSLFPILQ